MQLQNINLDEIKSIDDFKKIKTVTKQQFAENNFNFLCCKKSEIADYCTTSGTTGKPIIIALTKSDIHRLAQNEAHTFQLAQLSSHDICMLMLTLDRQFMAGIAYYEGLKLLGIPCIRSGSVSPQTQLKNMLQFQPTALVAVPSFLLKIIETAKEENIDLAKLSVRKVICIGEPIRNEQLLANNLAQNILSEWNVQLYSTYASSEMQTAFSECEAGMGNHINPNLIFAEILDEAGNELPEGEVGELTITTLGVKGMPLLRYRTGDMVFAIRQKCTCGSNDMRISPVLARKNELLKFKGTTIYPISLHNILQSEKSITDYLIEAQNEEGRTIKITVYLVCNHDDVTIQQSLQEKFKTHLRVTPEIAVCEQEQLNSLRPKEARKMTRFIVR